MDSFYSNFLSSLYVWDQDNNIVFDTHIRYNKYYILVVK